MLSVSLHRSDHVLVSFSIQIIDMWSCVSIIGSKIGRATVEFEAKSLLSVIQVRQLEFITWFSQSQMKWILVEKKVLHARQRALHPSCMSESEERGDVPLKTENSNTYWKVKQCRCDQFSWFTIKYVLKKSHHSSNTENSYSRKYLTWLARKL